MTSLSRHESLRPKHTFIHNLVLPAVLALFQIILLADTSSAAPDTAQSDGRKTLYAQQALSEIDEVSSDTRALDEGPVTVLTQQNEDEVKEAQEAAPVESENLYEGDKEDVQIPDPLAPVNKVMFHFNDKLYFWALKPVTQLYSHIIPEDFRFVFGNAYDNLWAPARFVNNLLQLRFKSAGNELIRFLFNSVAGIGGLHDFAKDAFGIKKQEADFGQTLGHYGIGHGFYLVLPVFGPSSLRDGIGLAGDRFMYPLTYVSRSDLSLEETYEIYAHEKVNDTSFKIGDYESFKEAAIDPYISMRDAFVQHRKKDVEESNR